VSDNRGNSLIWSSAVDFKCIFETYLYIIQLMLSMDFIIAVLRIFFITFIWEIRRGLCICSNKVKQLSIVTEVGLETSRNACEV